MDSPKNKVLADDMLRNSRVAGEISRRQAKLRDTQNFDLAQLFKWTVSMATADPRKLFKPGAWIPLAPNEIIDDKLAVLIEGAKTVEKTNKDGTVTRTTYIKIANRSPYFAQLQNLLGVPKSVDIKVNTQGKISLATIDEITTNYDRRAEQRARERREAIDVTERNKE